MTFAKKTVTLELSLLTDDAKAEANFSAQWLRADTNACKWPRWTQSVEKSTPTTLTNPASVKRKKEQIQTARCVRTDNTESTEWKVRSLSHDAYENLWKDRSPALTPSQGYASLIPDVL